jgi:molybdopterin molybdotransferase
MEKIRKNDEEIDEGEGHAGYQEAIDLISANVKTVGTEDISLTAAAGRVAAQDIVACESYPSADVSLKDGYAIVSADIEKAVPEKPVRLKVTGSIFAGPIFTGKVTKGTAVKICSGGRIPEGAEAVISIEFTDDIGSDEILVKADAGVGRNILKAGAEVKAGEHIVKQGEKLTPGFLGLAAAAGISRVAVYRRPTAAVVGVGDEVVAPGGQLYDGQLYASNMVTMESRLKALGINCFDLVAQDNETALEQGLNKCFQNADVILTSGGAWGSEKDLVVSVLNKLGWKELFHHVRMGPGKGIAFGVWDGKPVFCLPGGPPSNEMAFIQLALPGIMRMAGDNRNPIPSVNAVLLENVKGRHPAWTEFKDAILTRDNAGTYAVKLYRSASRLRAVASANGLICKPEGRLDLAKGEAVKVFVLEPGILSN